MVSPQNISPNWNRSVVFISLLLLFFTIPHTLEDFAVGEPANAGIPAPILSLVIAMIFAVQGVGIYWLGQNRRRGLWVQAGIGLFWPVASGLAQLPTIVSGAPYRAGAISILYVVGIIGVGLLLLGVSIFSLTKRSA